MGKTFGEYLKKLRTDRKLTLREVEKDFHISNGYLSQVERGERSTPTMKILMKLAMAYGVPLSVLSHEAEAEMRLEIQQREKNAENGGYEEIMPNPDTEFICRGYENLSEEKKRTLKDFLQYLQKEDKSNKK